MLYKTLPSKQTIKLPVLIIRLNSAEIQKIKNDSFEIGDETLKEIQRVRKIILENTEKIRELKKECEDLKALQEEKYNESLKKSKELEVLKEKEGVTKKNF